MSIEKQIKRLLENNSFDRSKFKGMLGPLFEMQIRRDNLKEMMKGNHIKNHYLDVGFYIKGGVKTPMAIVSIYKSEDAFKTAKSSNNTYDFYRYTASELVDNNEKFKLTGKIHVGNNKIISNDSEFDENTDFKYFVIK